MYLGGLVLARKETKKAFWSSWGADGSPGAAAVLKMKVQWWNIFVTRPTFFQVASIALQLASKIA